MASEQIGEGSTLFFAQFEGEGEEKYSPILNGHIFLEKAKKIGSAKGIAIRSRHVSRLLLLSPFNKFRLRSVYSFPSQKSGPDPRSKLHSMLSILRWERSYAFEV